MMPKEFLPNPEGTIGFTSHRTSLAIEKYLNKKFEESGIDINLNQWGFIYYLFKNEYISQKKITQKFLLPDFELESLVKELQKKEFITFQKDKDIFVLTDKGTKQVLDLIPILGQALLFFRGDINPQEMLIAINVLNKIYHNIYPEEELYILEAPPFFEGRN